MKTPLLYTLGLIICFGCNSSTKNETALNTESVADSAQTAPAKEYYKVLRQEQPGNFKNFDLLVEQPVTKLQDIIIAIKIFKAEHCSSLPCNGVTLWDDEKALKLYENKQDDAKWRRKNWPFVCEHQVAYYNSTVNELDMYPFMDSEYRRWGGKKKRPISGSYDIE